MNMNKFIELFSKEKNPTREKYLKVANLLESLSSKEIDNLFSDKKWNKHPVTIKYGYLGSQKNGFNIHYPSLISDFISFVISNKNNYPKINKSIYSRSTGSILYFAIKKYTGKDKISLMRRSLKTYDERCHKLSARYLPISDIKKYNLKSSKNTNINRIVARRIGTETEQVDNFDIAKAIKIYGITLESLNIDFVVAIDLINKICDLRESNITKFSSTDNYSTYICVKKLLNFIPDEKIPFILRACNLSKSIGRLIEKRVL